MKRLAKKKSFTPSEPEPTARTNALTYRHYEERWYIAIHAGGYGVDTDIARAILSAQESVPAKAKCSQLLIYRHHEEIHPIGFVEWPDQMPTRANGKLSQPAPPKLVGCTNTHQGWIRRKDRSNL